MRWKMTNISYTPFPWEKKNALAWWNDQSKLVEGSMTPSLQTSLFEVAFSLYIMILMRTYLSRSLIAHYYAIFTSFFLPTLHFCEYYSQKCQGRYPLAWEKVILQYRLLPYRDQFSTDRSPVSHVSRILIECSDRLWILCGIYRTPCTHEVKFTLSLTSMHFPMPRYFWLYKQAHHSEGAHSTAAYEQRFFLSSQQQRFVSSRGSICNEGCSRLDGYHLQANEAVRYHWKLASWWVSITAWWSGSGIFCFTLSNWQSHSPL